MSVNVTEDNNNMLEGLDLMSLLMEQGIPILVLSADNFSDGEVRGTSVNYVIDVKLDPHSNNDTSLGQKAAKVWGDVDLYRKIPFAPAVYKGKFAMRTGSDGKPSLRLVDLDFVGCGHFVLDNASAVKPTTAASGK